MKSAADRKWHSRLENLMSISWFVMDCFWMNGWMVCSELACIVGLLSVFGIHIILQRTPDIKAEFAQFMVTCWFVMNSMWMMSDVDPSYRGWAQVFMWLAIATTLAVAIIDSSLLSRFRRAKM